MLKKAAATVNVGYGMDPKVGEAIQQAADEVCSSCCCVLLEGVDILWCGRIGYFGKVD